MERIFFVENYKLDEVNDFLWQTGGKVKMMQTLSENVAAYGYAGGESSWYKDGCYTGTIYAYIVVEY